MATIEQLEAALINADNAGDADAARMFASEIQSIRAEKEIPEPNLEIFRDARKSGLLKGWMDQGAGIAQIVERFKDLTGQGGKTQFVDDFIKKEEKGYQQERQKQGDDGFDGTRIMGNIANPISLAGMATPYKPGLAQTLKMSVPMGAGYGSIQPVTEGNFVEEKKKQAGLGATMGAVIPSGFKGLEFGGRYVDEIIKPFSKGGIKRDVELYLRDHAGPAKEKIINALKGAQEIVPGNKPTSSQAIAKAVRETKRLGEPDDFGGQFVKLEKEISKDPLSGDVLKSRYAQQQTGREKVVHAIAGTDDDMAKAVSKRTSETNPLYKAVEDSVAEVDAAPVISKIDDYLLKHKNESAVTKPLMEIRNKLLNGEDVEISPNALQSLSKDIKRLMGETTVSGQKAYNVKVLDDIKGALDEQIGKSEVAYAKAQQTYKELSEPVNQMQVGRELSNALENAVEKETPSTFTNAVRNAPRTIKRSTGFSRYNNLDDVLSSGQTSSVKKVADELANQSKATKMATDTNSILPDLPGEITFSLPRILSRPVVIANAILSRFGRQLGPEYKQVLSEILADPQALAKALQEPASSVRRQIAMDILKKGSVIVSSQEAARSQ